MPWYSNSNDDRLWYEERGSGPVIVLIHGWCMSSVVWQLQLEELSSSFRVIAPDLRGHGRSSTSSDGYDLDSYVADIAALFNQLGLEDALLAGWSLGAQIVLQVFAQLREKVAGVGLISGTPRFTATKDFTWALGSYEADGMAVKLRRNTARALDGFVGSMFAPGELDDPILSARIIDLLSAIPVPDTGFALKSLQMLVEADMRGLLPGIDVPALIINGDQDVICLPGASEYMAQIIADNQHIVMPGCGHTPFLTRCREFDMALTEFRRRISDCSR